MTNAPLTIADGVVVSLDYVLQLDDGNEIDSSVGREPLVFLQGAGQIIPGLEQALYGLSVGDEKEVVVAPADGYGEFDDEAMQVVPRDVFPQDIDLAPGMGFRMRDEAGRTFEAYVAEVRPNGVLLDFNHPLAGETLYFQVKVVDLRTATADELAHGHAH